MIGCYNIIGEVLFSQSLNEIQQQLKSLRKDRFDPLDRIVIRQDVVDEYPYVDAVGTKLIEIQKIINQLDISNCFILIITANTDISREIEFITRFYSIDPGSIEFQLVDGDYKKIVKKYQNTACRKLWNHLYVGTDGNMNPCCLADHKFPLGNVDDDVNDIIKNNFEQIRSDMVQGYRNRACAICYEKEDQGVQTNRQICDPNAQTVRIKDVDIRLNNICNFKCRMCSEYFSSSIQQETIELYGKNPVMGFEKISLIRPANQVNDRRLQKILSFLNTDLKSIYFAGGEPLITGEHYKILDHLIEIKNTSLAIRYNTNLSMLSYKQVNVIDKWCQFSNITVGASIDASGAVAEYMRHGTIWDDIIANIHAIKQQASHVKLRITSMVCFMNVENLINLQNTWIDQQLFSVDDFQVQPLVSPNFLSVAVLPRKHKDRLNRIIENHVQNLNGTGLAQQWRDVLHLMNNNDYGFALDDFVRRTRVLDTHRNESFVKVFPEFQDLYV